jgi:hypothetical protein
LVGSYSRTPVDQGRELGPCQAPWSCHVVSSVSPASHMGHTVSILYAHLRLSSVVGSASHWPLRRETRHSEISNLAETMTLVVWQDHVRSLQFSRDLHMYYVRRRHDSLCRWLPRDGPLRYGRLNETEQIDTNASRYFVRTPAMRRRALRRICCIGRKTNHPIAQHSPHKLTPLICCALV